MVFFFSAWRRGTAGMKVEVAGDLLCTHPRTFVAPWGPWTARRRTAHNASELHCQFRPMSQERDAGRTCEGVQYGRGV